VNGDDEEHRYVIEMPKYYRLFVAMVKDNESNGE